jgi:hypothetical protein
MKFSHAYQYLLRLMLLVVVLLLVYATRVAITDQRTFDSDEVRIITRAEGTFAQVIAWQPTDWPPLFNLLVSAWLHGISDNPAMLRMISVFWAIFGIAATYRLGTHLFGSFWAGLASAVALAALAYHIELSIFLRGYMMALALFPLTLWLALRYFEHPYWKRAIPLAVSIAAMFYTTYISMFAFVIIGLVILVRHGMAIWRWWLPVLLSLILVIPELLYKYSRLTNRFTSSEEANVQQVQSLQNGIEYLSTVVLGVPFILWIALLVLVASFLLLKKPRTIAWVFLLVAVAAPFILYAIVEAKIIFHFHHRYVWWALLAIALFIGAGVAQMPRLLRVVKILVLVGLMFANINAYLDRKFYDYEGTFRWIAAQAEIGDVLIRDTNFCRASCGHGGMEWNYYQQRHLAHRVPLVSQPEDARRVWYIRESGEHNRALENAILDRRIPAQFFGPSYFLAQLYVAPPDPEGILFDNGMRFHGVDFLDDARRLQNQPVEVNEQTALHVRLWWSVDSPLAQDYSVSVQLISRDGLLIGQSDGAPQALHLQPGHPGELPQSLTAWQPDTLYVEERWLDIPDLDNFYVSQLYVTVYDWRDNTRFAAEGVDENGLLPIPAEVFVWGW